MFNELTHCTRTGLRSVVTFALVLSFLLCSMPTAFAQTVTGTIQGTITSGQGNTKLAGVAVSAVAPSGRYAATTDSNGFFTINGVTPDTYAVSFNRTGFAAFQLQGVTVVQGQVANASAVLNAALTQIGRTQARSTAGAFQPAQTTDQYNVNAQQIATTLGKTGGTNEANLLAAIPGASFDSTGYPVLRGGRENEEGFQFEGIDYTDALTHQFVNSLILNGAGNFQVQPGAGDASIGNAGTGAINVVAKRGTSPHFGQLEGDVYSGRFQHDLRGEYGWATPDGRYSDYASLYFSRAAPVYGAGGSDPLPLGAFFTGRSYQTANDVLNNFVYKFGRDNGQSLQFFYENTQFNVREGRGILPGTLPYKDNDPLFLATVSGAVGLTAAQTQAIMPFTPGQRYLTDTIGALGDGRTAINGNQPNETLKLQYSNNLNATTFVTAKFYRVNNVELFDNPYNGTLTIPFGDESQLQGGQRTGFALDGTKQLGSKNLLGFGGKYEFLTPVFGTTSATGAITTFNYAGNSLEGADFFTPGSCPAVYTSFGLVPNAGTGSPCGYVTGYLGAYRVAGSAACSAAAYDTPACPLARQLPLSNDGSSSTRQDFALYVKDTFSPTDRLKIDLGLRMDAVNWHYGECSIDRCLPTSYTLDATGMPTNYQFDYSQDTRTPRVLQPRAAISFQATRNDALRFSYGRSVQFPPLGFVENTTLRGNFNAFNNIPSRDPLTGTQAMFCSGAVMINPAFQNAPCASYADQLYWENVVTNTGFPVTPLKPVTFNNYDFSYSHLFPHQVAMKVTPFYNRSYDQTAISAQQQTVNGKPVFDANTGAAVLGPAVPSNRGKSQATGVEFLMTKEAAYGLSGSLSLTYQNVFSNVIPTIAGEDFFPSIPPESLALGNLYRVGYLSPFVGTLAVQERTRTGWRINPVLYYNKGYPYGSGLIAPISLNGVAYNVPNTNITSPAQLGGSIAATTYVDPRNPGSVFNPNVAATRGTPESASAGGVLSNATIGPAQLTIEYTSPRNPRSTFGALITNLFDQLYPGPVLNPRYQPVATGIAGPYSGYSANTIYTGVYNYTQRRGNQPYLLTPNNVPRTIQFYYQLNL